MIMTKNGVRERDEEFAEFSFLAVAPTETDPMVGDGTARSVLPFIDREYADKLAKPIEGGSYRNTEYTFF